MDIECANCGEPWDTYHLKNDEPYEWGVAASERQAFQEHGRFGGPDDPIRKAAEACGWKFAGTSLYGILRCPSCRSRPVIFDSQERTAKVLGITSTLGNDEDGLISELAK